MFDMGADQAGEQGPALCRATQTGRSAVCFAVVVRTDQEQRADLLRQISRGDVEKIDATGRSLRFARQALRVPIRGPGISLSWPSSGRHRKSERIATWW